MSPSQAEASADAWFTEAMQPAPRCAAPRCRGRVGTTGHGFRVPFCRRHWKGLPRALRVELVTFADGSIYDPAAIAGAVKALARALKALPGKRP